MNHLTALRSLAIAGLIIAAPMTGWARDKHHHESARAYRVYAPPACGPYYAPAHYYHSRPFVSLGFYSTPAYYYDTPDYSYDSYPMHTSYRGTYYRGIPRASYSYRENSSYGEDLAVDVQRALARRGFYRGEIDGDVGPGTRAAIRSYQYRHNLTVTGRIDGALLRSLRLS